MYLDAQSLVTLLYNHQVSDFKYMNKIQITRDWQQKTVSTIRFNCNTKKRRYTTSYIHITSNQTASCIMLQASSELSPSTSLFNLPHPHLVP